MRVRPHGEARVMRVRSHGEARVMYKLVGMDVFCVVQSTNTNVKCCHCGRLV